MSTKHKKTEKKNIKFESNVAGSTVLRASHPYIKLIESYLL
jgi:hypothetical protein